MTEPRYLSIADLRLVWADMTVSFRPVAITCFWAALRISEALGLEWEDIDFDA